MIQPRRTGACIATVLLAGVIGGSLALAGPAPTTDASADAEAEPAWGAPAAGLQAAVEPVGPIHLHGPMRFRLRVRSATGSAIRLPPAARAFGWMTVVQTFGDARDTYYSAKVPMPAGAWPAEVAGESPLRLGPFDLGPAKAYGRKVARRLLTAYLSGEGDLPEAAGVLARVLRPGKAVVKFTLCFRYEGERPTLVSTAATPVTIGPPKMADLADAERKKFLDDLMKQFDRGPWAGQQAHDTCVGLGTQVLPRVIDAAFETARPGHARLWLATTLADIRDPQAAAALVKLLGDASTGVRHVVAYHGPKQRDPRLDDAIVAKATGGDPALAAWALLGFMVHRQTVPEKVLAAGLESKDPKARATAAEVLARHASDENLARLTAMLADANPQVRGVAAKMLGRSGRPAPAVLGAMIRALDLPGETARQRLCRALSDLTGKDWPYDPTADADTRAARLAQWKAWWAKRPSGG